MILLLSLSGSATLFATTCEDSDADTYHPNGLRNWYQKGTITGLGAGETLMEKEDYCVEDVIEQQYGVIRRTSKCL